MKKNIFVLIVAALLFFSTGLIAFGEDESPVVSVGNAVILKGESNKVEIPIMLSGNKGFTDLCIEIGYNADVLTLTGVKNKVSDEYQFMYSGTYAVNPYLLWWSTLDKIEVNGELAIMEFKVKNDAPLGSYLVTVDFYKGRNGDYKDGVDANYFQDNDGVTHPLNLKYSDGYVRVATRKTIKITSGDKSVNFGTFDIEDAGTVFVTLYNDNEYQPVVIKMFNASDEISFETDQAATYANILYWKNINNPVFKERLEFQ